MDLGGYMGQIIELSDKKYADMIDKVKEFRWTLDLFPTPFEPKFQTMDTILSEEFHGGFGEDSYVGFDQSDIQITRKLFCVLDKLSICPGYALGREEVGMLGAVFTNFFAYRLNDPPSRHIEDFRDHVDRNLVNLVFQPSDDGFFQYALFSYLDGWLTSGMGSFVLDSYIISNKERFDSICLEEIPGQDRLISSYISEDVIQKIDTYYPTLEYLSENVGKIKFLVFNRSSGFSYNIHTLQSPNKYLEHTEEVILKENFWGDMIID
jgi:hypothetical protein